MKIDRKISGDRLELVVEGRIDTITSPEFQKTAVPLPEGVKSIAVDLAQVEYVSSAGLRAMAALSLAAKEAGGALTVSNLQEDVKTVFDMTGFSAVLGLA